MSRITDATKRATMISLPVPNMRNMTGTQLNPEALKPMRDSTKKAAAMMRKHAGL